MIWLLLDTACPRAVVAIVADEQIVAQIYLDETLKHGERLPDAVAKCLVAAQLVAAEIQALAVGTGPGSFVGVRIAMAYAKGFALARQVPLVGVCTLSAMAASEGAPAGRGLAFLDARRGEFYVRAIERMEDGANVRVLALADPMTQARDTLAPYLSTEAPGGWLIGEKISPMSGPSAQGLWRALQTRLQAHAPVVADEKFELTPTYARAPDAKLWA